jgi:hypothetical protein
MSNSVIFLLGVVVLSLLGGFVLWLRERSPQSMEAHMKAFERQLEALSPDSTPEHARRRPSPRAEARPRTRGSGPG